MGCIHTPYGTESPVTCYAAGLEVQLAEAQQGARPEETTDGRPGAWYPPAQDAAILLHAIHSRAGRELGALITLQAC